MNVMNYYVVCKIHFKKPCKNAKDGNIIIRRNEKMRTIRHCEHRYITMHVCEDSSVLLRKSLIWLLVWLYYTNSTVSFICDHASKNHLPGSAQLRCAVLWSLPASTNRAALFLLSSNEQQREWERGPGARPCAFAEVWRSRSPLCWFKPRPVSIRCFCESAHSNHNPTDPESRLPAWLVFPIASFFYFIF